MHHNRLSVPVVLVCLFAASHLTAHAAPPREGSRPAATATTRDLPQELAAAVVKFIRSITGKTGCAVDPLGRCQPFTTTTAEPGCQSNDPQERLDLR